MATNQHLVIISLDALGFRDLREHQAELPVLSGIDDRWYLAQVGDGHLSNTDISVTYHDYYGTVSQCAWNR